MKYPQIISKTELPARNAPLAALAMTFKSSQVPYFPRKYDAEDLKVAGRHFRSVANNPKEKLTADELVAWGWYWRSYRRYPLEHPSPQEYFQGLPDGLVGPEFRAHFPSRDCGVDPHSGRWEPARAANLGWQTTRDRHPQDLIMAIEREIVLEDMAAIRDLITGS